MSLWQEIRFGASQIRKSPLTAVAAIAAIALGIAANAAMFSVVDGFLWKPLSFPNGKRLQLFYERDKKQPDYYHFGFSAAAFERWRAASTKLELLSAFSSRTSTIGTSQGPESSHHTFVTGDFFPAIGVNPQLGRTLQPSDTTEGRGSIVVLSDRFWKSTFNADPSIVGQTILINEIQHQVVGVMPVKFDYPQQTDLWTPAAWTPADRADRKRQAWTGIALLKRGATLAEASGELNSIGADFARENPAEQGSRYAAIGPLREMSNSVLTKQYSLLAVYASLFVLLIACTNVANLQFTQAAARKNEIAVRMSMGAGRWDILRMLLVQSTMVALMGGALGLILAFWWVDLVVKSMPPEVERFVMGWSEIAIDYRTLGFVLFLACLSGVVSGLIPAWRSSSWDIANTLREAGRSGFSGRGTMRLRSAMIVLQLSVSVVLLTGAGLMIKGFGNLLNRTSNLRAERVLVARVELPLRLYGRTDEIRSRHQALLRAIPSIAPGATAAVVDHVPFAQEPRDGSPFHWANEARPQNAPRTNLIATSESYAALVGARLLEGRWLSTTDGALAPRVAVVSETFARNFAGNTSPLGREVVLGEQSEPFRIVGVVSDVDDSSFQISHPAPVLYRTLDQSPKLKFDVMVAPSAGTDPLSIAPALRDALRQIDSGALLRSPQTFAKVISDERVGLAYIASMLGVLGLIAVVLAAVGLFALVAFNVAERAKEFGIRLATGATPLDIVRLVLKDGLSHGLIGLLIGVPAAVAVARLISGLLFGVSSGDLGVFAGVISGLLVVVAAASLVPASRAARTAPLSVLQRQ